MGPVGLMELRGGRALPLTARTGSATRAPCPESTARRLPAARAVFCVSGRLALRFRFDARRELADGGRAVSHISHSGSSATLRNVHAAQLHPDVSASTTSTSEPAEASASSPDDENSMGADGGFFGLIGLGMAIRDEDALSASDHTPSSAATGRVRLDSRRSPRPHALKRERTKFKSTPAQLNPHSKSGSTSLTTNWAHAESRSSSRSNVRNSVAPSRVTDVHTAWGSPAPVLSLRPRLAPPFVDFVERPLEVPFVVPSPASMVVKITRRPRSSSGDTPPDLVAPVSSGSSAAGIQFAIATTGSRAGTTL